MIETGQNFAFRAEAAENFFAIGPAFQQFDGYLLLKISVGARSEIDSSHSSLANLANDHICSDTFADFGDTLPRARGGSIIRALFQVISRVAKKHFGLR